MYKITHKIKAGIEQPAFQVWGEQKGMGVLGQLELSGKSFLKGNWQLDDVLIPSITNSGKIYRIIANLPLQLSSTHISEFPFTNLTDGFRDNSTWISDSEALLQADRLYISSSSSDLPSSIEVSIEINYDGYINSYTYDLPSNFEVNSISYNDSPLSESVIKLLGTYQLNDDRIIISHSYNNNVEQRILINGNMLSCVYEEYLEWHSFPLDGFLDIMIFGYLGISFKKIYKVEDIKPNTFYFDPRLSTVFTFTRIGLFPQFIKQNLQDNNSIAFLGKM